MVMGTTCRSVQKTLVPVETFRFPAIVELEALGRQQETWRSMLEAARPPRIVDALWGPGQGLTAQVTAVASLTRQISGTRAIERPGQNLVGLTGPGSALDSTLKGLDRAGPLAAAVSAMVPTPSTGVSSILGQQLADLRKLTTALSPAFSAFMEAENDRARWFTQLLDGVRPQVLRLAESLATDALQLGQQARQIADAWAQRAYFAMLAAQNAAVNDDIEAVEEFFVDWMDLPRRRWKERVVAGSDALIEVRLEEFGSDTVVDLLDLIEKNTNTRLRRGLTLLTETELNGHRVVSLESLSARTGKPFMAAEDFLPAAPSAEERAMARLNQINDARLAAVLGSLSPIEASVVWAHELTGDSWEAAAHACGLPASESERVRAKLHRRARRVVLASRTGVVAGR